MASLGARSVMRFLPRFLLAALFGLPIAPAALGATVYYELNDGSRVGTDPLVFSSTAPNISALNGAAVQVLTNSPSGLHALLQMPSITLNPLDSLTIASILSVSAGAFDGMTVTNDLFNTATLRFEVPPGTTLQTNSAVPLNWVVTVVPLPGTAGLFGAGLTGLVAWMRRRTRA